VTDEVHILINFNYEIWFYQCIKLRSELQMIIAIMNVTLFRSLHILRNVPFSSILFHSLFFFFL
jgi:hypothetical protein